MRGTRMVMGWVGALVIMGLGAAVVAQANFSDVDETHSRYRDIEFAVAQGWFQGYEDGTFKPDRAIPDYQVVTVLKRAFPEGATRADLAAFLRGGFERLNTLPPYSAVATSRNNPAPFGTQVRAGDWLFRVISVTSDATDVVLAENQFNHPPDDGEQFFLIRLEVTYVGEDSAKTSNIYWHLDAVGDRAVSYGAPKGCGVIPDAWGGEAFSGGVIVGNLCWKIVSSDADSLAMFVDDPEGSIFLPDPDKRIFLSLTP